MKRFSLDLSDAKYDQKIPLIKALRHLTGMSLAEARSVIESGLAAYDPTGQLVIKGSSVTIEVPNEYFDRDYNSAAAEFFAAGARLFPEGPDMLIEVTSDTRMSLLKLIAADELDAAETMFRALRELKAFRR